MHWNYPKIEPSVYLLYQFNLIDWNLYKSVPEIIDPVFAKTSPNRSFSMTEYERFGLVFTKTRVYKFGHSWLEPLKLGRQKPKQCDMRDRKWKQPLFKRRRDITVVPKVFLYFSFHQKWSIRQSNVYSGLKSSLIEKKCWISSLRSIKWWGKP